ncbi:hypothetical protein BHM03_00047473 [Ensete ventricosum]|nr:hypothetical protein BHM03_00047473 [Ensete ventricosum]
MARGSAEAPLRCSPRLLTLSARLVGAWRLGLGTTLSLIHRFPGLSLALLRTRSTRLLRPRSLGYPGTVEDEAEAQGYCVLGPWAVPSAIEDKAKVHGRCDLGPWAILSAIEDEVRPRRALDKMDKRDELQPQGKVMDG